MKLLACLPPHESLTEEFDIKCRIMIEHDEGIECVREGVCEVMVEQLISEYEAGICKLHAQVEHHVTDCSSIGAVVLLESMITIKSPKKLVN